MGTKIAITSDLHIGTARTEHLHNMKRDIETLIDPDVLILAGDIGESPYCVEIALEELRDTASNRIYIPGNHDLWKDTFNESDTLFNRILPELANNSGYKWKEGRLDIGDVSIVYTPAWHDMSLRVDWWPSWTNEDIHNEYWQEFSDGKWLTLDPVDLSNAQAEAFLDHISAIPSTTKALLVVSHYPIFEESYSPHIPKRNKDMAKNADYVKSLARKNDCFFYSPRFGKMLKGISDQRPNLKILSVSGHIHSHFDIQINEQIRAYSSSSDYHEPTVMMAEWMEGHGSWDIQESMVRSSTRKLANSSE